MRYVLRSLHPLRLIAMLMAAATAIYFELVWRSTDDWVDHGILAIGGLAWAWSAYTIWRSDRNYREGRVVFETHDDSIVITPSAIWARQRRVPHAGIASITVRRRGDKVSLRFEPRAGRFAQLRVDQAVCDQILGRMPREIPVRHVEVPVARAVKV